MNKGFSLVELIVVIAIMAILIGVAVPTYTAYIEKAEKGVELQVIGDMVYAAKLANIEYGTTAELAYADGKVTITFKGEGDTADTDAASAAAQVKNIMADADDVVSSEATVTFEVDRITGDDTDFKNLQNDLN